MSTPLWAGATSQCELQLIGSKMTAPRWAIAASLPRLPASLQAPVGSYS